MAIWSIRLAPGRYLICNNSMATRPSLGSTSGKIGCLVSSICPYGRIASAVSGCTFTLIMSVMGIPSFQSMLINEKPLVSSWIQTYAACALQFQLNDAIVPFLQVHILNEGSPLLLSCDHLLDGDGTLRLRDLTRPCLGRIQPSRGKEPAVPTQRSGNVPHSLDKVDHIPWLHHKGRQPLVVQLIHVMVGFTVPWRRCYNQYHRALQRCERLTIGEVNRQLADPLGARVMFQVHCYNCRPAFLDIRIGRMFFIDDMAVWAKSLGSEGLHFHRDRLCHDGHLLILLAGPLLSGSPSPLLNHAGDGLLRNDLILRRGVKLKSASSITRSSRFWRSTNSTYDLIVGTSSIRPSTSRLVPSPGSLRVTLMNVHAGPTVSPLCHTPLSMSAACPGSST